MPMRQEEIDSISVGDYLVIQSATGVTRELHKVRYVSSGVIYTNWITDDGRTIAQCPLLPEVWHLFPDSFIVDRGLL